MRKKRQPSTAVFALAFAFLPIEAQESARGFVVSEDIAFRAVIIISDATPAVAEDTLYLRTAGHCTP